MFQLSDYAEQIAERAAQTGQAITLAYNAATDTYTLQVNASSFTCNTMDINKSGNGIAFFDRKITQLLNEL